MNVWRRLMYALTAGREAWMRISESGTEMTLAEIYDWRWSIYSGDAFSKLARKSPYLKNSRIYANTRLLYKHVEAVVTFYATTVYQGDLSTDGKPLPDGTRGAIPIDPQVESEEEKQQLMVAIAELFSAWNWKQNMTLRPMYGAALGDVLTELVDDLDHGFVYPAIVWPSRVKHVELDYVGNVKSYVLEYRVEEEGEDGSIEKYKFRKEVDNATFKYFKEDKPFDYMGPGTAISINPYGFVPAVWDRHQISWGERGSSATDSTWQALQELNSMLSHAKDFQSKAFATPIILQGVITAPGQTTVQAGTAPTSDSENGAMAETTNWLQGDKESGIIQPEFDIGQTLAMIEMIKQGILDENPEASFYSQLRSMSQVTAPGAERLLGDAVSRCRRARAGYDANTVKLFQMAISMCGWRANGNGWDAPLTKRQKAFLPYTLESYSSGQMDFSISDRPVVLPTEQERIELIAKKESLQSQWALAKAGMEQTQIDSIIADRQIEISSFA